MFTWSRLRWFVLGFTAIFIGLALFGKGDFFTGKALITMPLWQYYWLELRRAFTPTDHVGAASGGDAAALSMFFQHVFVALAGGGAVHFLAARRTSKPRPAK